MFTKKILSYTCIICCIISISLEAKGQCEAKTLEEFYNCYGGESAFTNHSVKAISTFIEAEDAVKNGNYNLAKILVENLFKIYPRGSDIWWNVFNDPNGANLGTPHAYYGLRMMEDIVDYGLTGNPNVKAKKAKMKVVMVASSSGIQPTSKSEQANGTGTFVTHTIDPKLKENDFRIVKQSLDLFSKYVKAITKGSLELEIEFVELSSLNLPVKVSTTRPLLAYETIEPVWDALSKEDKDKTDWWWILYPSHVPEFPVFDDESFITGGMGSDSKGGPVFIIDDKWLTRKPAHLGKGNYSDIERRIYLPQWLQHEFYHHLYRIYPELELEVNGHDWFDRNFWPDDFEGQFETDYYSETLHKRLQVDCVPLAAKLITRVQDDLEIEYNKLSIDELLGTYSLDVIQNPWHEGNIILENGQYFWKNTANVKWQVTPNLSDGILKTGSDNPYPGKDFFVELYQNVEGSFLPAPVALKFQGDFYKKRFNLMRGSVPMEIALGQFERVPNEKPEHSGSISKQEGMLLWNNNAGSIWPLIPNTEEETLSLNADSPSPGEKLKLILVDSECETNALGFEYENHYYWKPKRSLTNASPIRKIGITDLVLDENFGNYNINLMDSFEDAERDSLVIFVTSENSSLITAEINDELLELSGNEIGTSTIYVMALDANGGLAVDTFNVEVKAVVSTEEILSGISIFPNVTQDFVQVLGLNEYDKIELSSLDNKIRKDITTSSGVSKIDLSTLPNGIYFVSISDSMKNMRIMKKVVKQ